MTKKAKRGRPPAAKKLSGYARVCLTKGEYEKLGKLARKQRVSISAFVRSLISEAVAA